MRYVVDDRFIDKVEELIGGCQGQLLEPAQPDGSGQVVQGTHNRHGHQMGY